MNSEKARAAATAALEAFTMTLDGEPLVRYGVEDAMTDLLADLMHLCDTIVPHDEDYFTAALGRAERHYAEEHDND